MTHDELFNVVRQIVTLTTGLDGGHVILQDQNSPSPGGDYCAVEVRRSARRHGKGNQSFQNVGPVTSPIGDVFDVEQTVKQKVLRDVSLNFYRGLANDHAVSMLGAEKRFDVHELLMRNDLGWITTSPVNDLTGLQSGSYEPRAEVTITIASEETQVVTGNAIYGVNILTEGADGVQLQTDTVNAPTE